MQSQKSTLESGLAGRYEIEREIGAGGMATVYLARDLRHQRRVAVKVLDPELGAVLGADRFLSEIRVTANLQHPNLLPLFDSGEANGLLFYVMPYIEGETLRHRLDREKQLPIDEVVRLTTGIANALDYAHRQGVVHRDLKPENILLHDGQPLIADFGIALAVSNAGGQRITQTGLSLGTPQYMSPEQATGDRGVDGRTDIYSLGAVAYEMIGGEPAHHGTSAQAIIAKLMTEEARSLTTLRKNVPPHIAGAIHRALEKLPADRWQTAKEFCDALTNTNSVAFTAASTASKQTGVMRLLPWTIAAAAVILASAVSLRDRRAAPPMPSLRIPVATTGNHGAATDFAFAPDGKSFAYITTDLPDNTQRIFVRRLDDLNARLLQGSDSASYFSYSPDGESIAFTTGTQVKKVNLSSGSVTAIAQLEFPSYGVSWGVDSLIVISSGGHLLGLSPNGGATRPLGGDSLEVTRRYPLALPDGDHVLFSAGVGGGAPLSLASLKSGTIRPLGITGMPRRVVEDVLYFSSATGNINAVGFDLRNGKIIGEPVPTLSDIGSDERVADGAIGLGMVIYSVRKQPFDLVEVRPDGSRLLGVKPSGYSGVRRSPDGKRIAVTISKSDGSDIWVGQTGSTTFDRLTNEGSNVRPEWSADSREVLFQSDRDGTISYWQQPADGARPARKVFGIPGSPIFEAVYSPDGKYLVYRTGTQTSADIWFRGVEGDTTPKPLATSKFAEDSPRISPDGKWVAFTSTSSGTREIYVMPFPSLDRRLQVTHGGGGEPVWSGNNGIFYMAAPTVYASVTLAMMQEARIVRTDTLPRGPWNGGSGHPVFDVLPDGKGVLTMRRLPGTSQMVIETGFEERVRKLLKR